MTRANAFALIPEDVVRVAKGEKVLLHMIDLPEDR
jgi:molybdopterin biosynthesis enzyme